MRIKTKEDNATVKRNEKGQLMPGSGASLNPGGRFKWLKYLNEELEIASARGVKFLNDIIEGKQVEITVEGQQQLVTPRVADRIRAVEIVLNFSLVKPAAKVEVTVEPRPQWIVESSKEDILKLIEETKEEKP